MAGIKILIIDDNVNLSHTLKLSLEQVGHYEIMIENNPIEAKHVARNFLPDIILMDVIMPYIDGGTLAADIRQDDYMKNIPVIFLTSILGKDEATAKGGRIGNDPVIAKPVTISELTKQIEKSLTQR